MHLTTDRSIHTPVRLRSASSIISCISSSVKFSPSSTCFNVERHVSVEPQNATHHNSLRTYSNPLQVSKSDFTAAILVKEFEYLHNFLCFVTRLNLWCDNLRQKKSSHVKVKPIQRPREHNISSQHSNPQTFTKSSKVTVPSSSLPTNRSIWTTSVDFTTKPRARQAALSSLASIKPFPSVSNRLKASWHSSNSSASNVGFADSVARGRIGANRASFWFSRDISRTPTAVGTRLTCDPNPQVAQHNLTQYFFSFFSAPLEIYDVEFDALGSSRHTTRLPHYVSLHAA